MKKILSLIVLLSASFTAISAEDGTGQGKSAGSSYSDLVSYCSSVLNAEDGTGQGKAEDGTGQSKAEDGTGQGKAEDGTGQDSYSEAVVNYCIQVLK